ncbi:MAG: DUF1501 domain-containing protein [Candidatus Thiodiazotropha sp. (ex Myrtea sp. 'scaly one' KF741663)]|nr:DUF1501 domain-containing protein [Candidatus Thiodiazotropha sp. (ex Myrtea sp. 'scaly one' KF741663)]
MKKCNKSYSRRDFLKALAGAGAIGALGSAGQLAFIKQAMANAPAFSDYKALVCIFLYGGNDSFNMFVPTATHGAYAAVRGTLGVSNTDLGLPTIAGGTDLNNGNLSLGALNPYNVEQTQATAYTKGIYPLSGSNSVELGVNGVMPELAQLITDSKANIVANVGTLVNPVTRSEILAQSANLPLFLFAHNHQQRALQTGQADNLNDVGWAGRIADNWSGINNNSTLGLNLSYAGNDRMLIGNDTTPLVLKPSTPPVYSGMKLAQNNVHDDRRALFKALAEIQGSGPNVTFGATNTFNTADPFMDLYSRMQIKSMDTFDALYNTWVNNPASYTSTGSYGEPLFSVPSNSDLGFTDDIKGSLIGQLSAVANMIDLSANNVDSLTGFNRQIFFVQLGGFDTHSSQLNTHPLLLRELSLALWKFQKALEEKGHANKVTTFTMSDFGRTVSNNGSGTDHAWGAHHIVMGGDGLGSAGNLDGGRMLGSLPDLSLGGTDDYSGKGRIIPTLAQDQLNASLCNWFGVDTTLMPNIFPNLVNFQTGGGIDSAYLNLFT